MIIAYNASPNRITERSNENVGKGTGIARYASGLYLGGPSTVEHYLKDYERYTPADARFYRNGVEVPTASKAYDVMAFLANHRFDGAAARAHFANDPDKLAVINLLEKPDGSGFDFTVERGVCYEVTLKNISQEDCPHWDDMAPDDVLNSAINRFYGSMITQDDIDALDLESLNIPDVDGFEELVEEAFESAYEQALEDDELGMSVDRDELFDMWLAHVRGDGVFSNSHEQEFAVIEDSVQMELLKKVTHERLVVETEMTYGDVYQALSHAFEPDNRHGNDLTQGKQAASLFMAKELNIPVFQCNSMFGLEGSQEFVVMDPALIESAEFNELTHSEFKQKVSEERQPMFSSRRNDLEQEFDYSYDMGRRMS